MEEEGKACHYKDSGVALGYILQEEEGTHNLPSGTCNGLSLRDLIYSISGVESYLLLLLALVAYGDEKLQSVLGHFQKDFEGLVSAESLGPKFDEHGSFLPRHQLSPSVISHPKTHQRAPIYIKSGSPKNLHMEGAPQKSMAPSNFACGGMLSMHNPNAVPADVSAEKYSQLLSAQVGEKSSVKHEPSLSRPLNPNAQRTLRVRIKVGSNSKAQKNAAIYSGLGLISPCLSMGNSPETLENSPSTTIQDMNIFPVPVGLLLSPLHEGFLCLLRKENISPDGKHARSFNVQPKVSAMLRDDLNSMPANGKVSEFKKTRSVGKFRTLEETEHENGMDFEDNMTSSFKKNREVNRSYVRGNFSFREQQDANSSLMEKIREHQERSSNKNVLANPREGGKSKCIRIRIPSKADFDLSMDENNSNTRSVVHVKQKVAPKVMLPRQDDIKVPYSTKKLSFDGEKKSKRSQNNGELVSVLAEKRFKSDFRAEKNGDNCKDGVDTRLEQTANKMNLLESPSGDWAKGYNCVNVKEKHAPREGPPRIVGHSSEAEMTFVAPAVLQEDWVCCDRCQKWRLLPYDTKPDQLPENWPGMNRCDLSEEETTKALYALYQVPLPETQKTLHGQADGTASVVTSAGVCHFNQSHHNLSSNAIPNQGKKNCKSKTALKTASNCRPVQISNSAENSQREVVTSRRLNDIQPLLEISTMNKSNAPYASKEKHGAKLVNIRVDSKQKRRISKTESNQNGSNTKKIKIEGAPDTDKYCQLNLTTQFPMEPISSCSKIWGIHKRTNFQEVKGSLVESISSSPTRTSNLDKLSPTRMGASESESAKNGDFLAIRSTRKTSEGEGNFESDRFGKGTEGEASGILHPKSFELPVLDLADGDARCQFGGKAESFIKSAEFENCRMVNTDADNLPHYYSCLIDAPATDRLHGNDGMNTKHYCDIVRLPHKTAINVLKEAEDLVDCADRLKKSGFHFECNETYFQAAQKFLHGASLTETCKDGNSKCKEITQIQIYSNAAKLCKTCAHEYEKRKEMAAAALAYKCMEVALMRVVYCKSFSIKRDWSDLQASLQMVPQGESPSSSLSCVENLNNQAAVDKSALSRGTNSHAGNHIIVARNCPSFVRLLDFTSDVNSAMEASRKCHSAFAAANVIPQESQNKEDIIISVRRVINFGFQDVEEFVRLIRVAAEAISSQGYVFNWLESMPEDHLTVPAALFRPLLASVPRVEVDRVPF
ncbi:hypothetical protein LguiB_014646 [Lonicera macranthoides]